ncbi:MAG: NADH-quinone oxidoreductase subunit C [Actinomycetota bacterium]
MGDAAGAAQLEHDRVVITVDKARVVDVVRTLKTDPELNCNYFTFLSAVDWQDEGFEVLIALYSTVNLNTVVIRVLLSKDEPSMSTITGIYGGANWHERECAEMFGITFEGHPYPKNLYLPDDFEGHPLLKSFKLASRTYKPWP